jgi:putative membrane protein insertion efficiency factor
MTASSAEPHGLARRLVRAVEWYQRAVEGRPSPCRFTPSCSAYAREALSVHGAGRGSWLTVRRLVRCRPLGPSGWDPVPEPASSSRAHAHGTSTPSVQTSTVQKGD